jgi:hypothetical protein
MAVRITLSGNSNLEWSNPRWQRHLALAFAVLALGCLCKLVASAMDWILLYFLKRYHRLSSSDFQFLYSARRMFNDVWPIIGGVGLCLMARHERRYPDRWRVSRWIVLVAGLSLLAVSVAYLVMTRAGNSESIVWVRYYLWRILAAPWPGVVIAVLTCTLAGELARRGNSRWLRQVSQVPLWAVAAGTLIWFSDTNELTWLLRSIVWDSIFPVSVLGMSTMTIRILLRGAREASANWVTDP